MKKFLSLILAVLLAVGLAVPAMAAGSSSFSDVAANAWYANAVAYVSGNGLMNGVGGGKFDPDGTTTRGQIMTILARMEGVSTSGSSPWYQKGMEWAKSAGISDGSSPEQTITREQLATMLWRYSGKPASSAALNGFSDASGVSDYAVSAMAWATESGIIKGSGGKLNPQGTTTRAEAATMLMRLDQMLDDAQGSPEQAGSSWTVKQPVVTVTPIRTFKDQDWYQIGIIEAENCGHDQPNEKGHFTYKSSDPNIVQVYSNGDILGFVFPGPGETVEATITVTHTPDGTTRQVKVIIGETYDLPSTPSTPSAPSYTFNDEYVAKYAAEVLRLVNQARAENGVNTLTYAAQAATQEGANIRSAELVKWFGHAGTYNGIMAKCGSTERFTVENIYAKGMNTICSPEELARSAVEAWMNSSGHRANILNARWTTMVIGLDIPNDTSYGGKYTAYSAQLFN